MSRYDAARKQASTLMPILIDSKDGTVRFDSLTKLHNQLIALAFRYPRKEQYGPEGGWQLFDGLDLPESALLVRIKMVPTLEGLGNRPKAANDNHLKTGQ